ncbi:MAG: hypothetical protein GX298_01980 [Planctomycetes bacterium]|jgi:methanogenic corrinoid protein MtbC1|nr:hypothetical protein [Planctomycetota bacterium]
MANHFIRERYLEALLTGDRQACRSIIEEALQAGTMAIQIYMDIIWPIMVEIDNLYRQDRILPAQEAVASRINRSIVNQLQNKLPRRPAMDRRVVIVTASNEQAELGGQMTCDLFESDGWRCRFLGGTVNNEDVLEFIHGYAPDILLLYGFNGKEAPAVRDLIDRIRQINAWPNMRIMLSGGVFMRAEGLWEEIGADLYAETAAEAIRIASLPAEDLPAPVRTIKQHVYAKKSQEPAATVR